MAATSSKIEQEDGVGKSKGKNEVNICISIPINNSDLHKCLRSAQTAIINHTPGAYGAHCQLSTQRIIIRRLRLQVDADADQEGIKEEIKEIIERHAFTLKGKKLQLQFQGISSGSGKKLFAKLLQSPDRIKLIGCTALIMREIKRINGVSTEKPKKTKLSQSHLMLFDTNFHCNESQEGILIPHDAISQFKEVLFGHQDVCRIEVLQLNSPESKPGSNSTKFIEDIVFAQGEEDLTRLHDDHEDCCRTDLPKPYNYSHYLDVFGKSKEIFKANVFLSITINNPELHKSLRSAQTAIINHTPNAYGAYHQMSTQRIRLLGLNLDADGDQAVIKRELKEIIERSVTTAMEGKKLQLQFQGLGSEGQYLYANMLLGPDKKKLYAFTALVRHEMKKINGNSLPKKKRFLNPRMMLFNNKLHSNKSQKIIPIPLEAFNQFEETFFGHQDIFRIEVLQLDPPGPKPGPMSSTKFIEDIVFAPGEEDLTNLHDDHEECCRKDLPKPC